MIKKQIHINQHVIRSNKKNGAKEPVVTVKTYKSNDYGHEVNILGSSKVIYSPQKPLACGAKVWIETKSPVEVKNTLTGHTKVV
tara:strand:+ start:493 stop:744 length:252 start_codon:yes stop_codon:yes gene_type:complete